jgi:hypothetical protein
MRAAARRRLLSLLVLGACLWPVVASGQASVFITWHRPDIQTFFLSDFEPSDTSVHPDLFTIIITNTLGTPQLVKLRFFISVASVIDPLLSAESNEFTLDPAGLTISNRELSDPDRPFGLQEYTLDSDAAEDLFGTVLETGLLPSDTYTFRIEVYGPTGLLLSSAEHPLVVTNPSRVDLIGPGAQFGGFLPVVAISTPQFFWSTDALDPALTANFMIKVVRVEEAASAEEAISGFAAWESGMDNQTTTIYPASVEAIPLEPGATYAWQIKRLVDTSGGIRELESDIFWFKMEDEASGIFGAGVDEEVTSMLDQIIELQGLTSDLEGFHPTGQILVDGRPVSLNSLRNLLERVLAGTLQIATIIIR